MPVRVPVPAGTGTLPWDRHPAVGQALLPLRGHICPDSQARAASAGAR
ncbi:Uncharacterised protein [Bordetella pertussis]|nr:Uncharacterised protein [Bordetella pertussis]